MSVLLEFSMSPLDKGESVGAYVARSLEIIEKSGVNYRLNPMGTVLEGDWDTVFNVVRDCYQRMSQDCDRISVGIKVDARKGKENRLEGKIESLERRLGHPLKKS
ncbi:MAG: MTH1187 family thiamine-binding protein [Leptospirales bacterium]